MSLDSGRLDDFLENVIYVEGRGERKDVGRTRGLTKCLRVVGQFRVSV